MSHVTPLSVFVLLCVKVSTFVFSQEFFSSITQPTACNMVAASTDNDGWDDDW